MQLPRLPDGGEGGSERWLITYADMITLLLVMFIVLYAFANTDLKKFEALAKSLAQGFGATSSAGAAEGEPAGTERGSSPVFDTSGGGTTPLELFPEEQTPIQIFAFAKQLQGGDGESSGLREKMEKLLAKANAAAGASLEGLKGKFDISYNERGIVISIYPDQILFDSGSARLKPAFREILSLLAAELRALPNDIEVDGHTDNIPISTGTFPSNWELSAARAGAVIRHLQGQGLPPERLSAAGYADTRPIDSNNTREGRGRNRRVEIIVLRMAGEQWPPVEAAPGASSKQTEAEQPAPATGPAQKPVAGSAGSGQPEQPEESSDGAAGTGD